MKEVSAVLPPPVQVPDPVTEGPLDELQEPLVPAQEDELPQGALELMATLILRHRPAMETGHAVAWYSMASGQETVEVERGEARSPAPVGVSYPQPGSLPHKPIPHLKPEPVSSSSLQPMSQISPSTPQPMPSAIRVEPALVESPSSRFEPLPVEHPVSSSTPSAPTVDRQLSEAVASLPTMRHAPPVAPPPVASAVIAQALPALDLMPETLPGPDRGLLQVPFNSGAASGQVTISRMADEPTRNLLLSPSNALVFDQIKTALDLTRDPAWQLTDNEGEQQGRGSHQPPDEEPAEQQDLPA
ncbi:invasion protein [Pseudomonas putida]|uniref:SpaN/EivJ family type III secretion system needle length determinant n=1 Tax=Pseudomonas putida TaxID=303 RepID=UPI003D99B816